MSSESKGLVLMTHVKRPQNLYSALFCIVSGLGVTALSQSIMYGQSVADPMGPATYPSLLGGIIAVLGVMLLVPVFAGGEGIEGKAEIFSFKDFVPLLVVSFWCVLYLVLLERIGFVPTNVILLMGCLKSMGEKNVLKMLSFSAITAIVLYYIFRTLLGVPLPTTPFLDI
jgi:putative tricarboxylic transport membrane protein